MKDFKIENLARIYWCKLDIGEYSDHTEYSFFFYAGTPEQALAQLTQFLKENPTVVNGEYGLTLVWKNKKISIVASDDEYGYDDMDCEIKMLPVVVLKRPVKEMPDGVKDK